MLATEPLPAPAAQEPRPAPATPPAVAAAPPSPAAEAQSNDWPALLVFVLAFGAIVLAGLFNWISSLFGALTLRPVSWDRTPLLTGRDRRGIRSHENRPHERLQGAGAAARPGR